MDLKEISGLYANCKCVHRIRIEGMVILNRPDVHAQTDSRIKEVTDLYCRARLESVKEVTVS